MLNERPSVDHAPAPAGKAIPQPSPDAETPLRLRQLPYDPVAWRDTVQSYADAEVFQSPEWLAYLQRYRDVEPVAAELLDGGAVVGHFVGAISRHLGLRVLGSPRSGWGTNKMGFLLQPGVRVAKAAEALLDFAYGDLGCVHVELWDRHMRVEDARTLPYALTTRETWEVDLSGSEQEILSRMKSRTRTYVRRASRTGLRIEEVSGADFADEFYPQLVDVFESSDLVPTYGVDRVRDLIESLEASGQLLMLRVRDSAGEPIASVLTVGRGARATLWGLGWYRAAAKDHPVEPLQWEVMLRWRERGATVYDLDGPTLAKAKFGGEPRTEAHLHHSKYAVLDTGRDAVRALFYSRQRVLGRLHSRRSRASSDADDR